MKRFLLPAFALALAVNANATSFQANMSTGQQAEAQAAQETVTYKGKLNIKVYGGQIPTDATIVVSKESNGTYTFILKDFSVTVAGATLNIGDATISDLEPKESNGVITLECTDKDAPVTNGGMDGILKDNKVIISMKSTIDNYVLTTDISKLTVRLLDEEENGYSEILVTADFKSDSYTLPTTPTATTPQLNDFSGDWETCIPWDSKGNTESSGTQPKGWHISNVQTAVGAVVAGAKAEGSNGTTVAVKLTNQEMAGQMIPAYMSLGTPWATAETKGTKVRNADGGVFGGTTFTYRPDAISFDYQRDNSKRKENATAIAYLWKGTWTQTNVPGNTAVGIFGYGTATKVTMTNRDRNVLGNETSATLGDKPAKPSKDAKLIAKLEQPISESTKGTWKSMTIPFTYNDKTAVPEYINVIFAANDYFGDRNGIVAGNSLTIDNVKLVYYHALNSLTYNGTPVANFDEGTTEYTLNGKLAEDFDKVKFTIKGVGATYDVAKDEANNVATITVKGNDYDVNPSSKTVYTIKFDGTVGINGITTSTTTANGAIYDLSGRQLKTMQKGINIVRGKDGKMIKVMK